jgi:hypothetical protein
MKIQTKNLSVIFSETSCGGIVQCTAFNGAVRIVNQRHQDAPLFSFSLKKSDIYDAFWNSDCDSFTWYLDHNSTNKILVMNYKGFKGLDINVTVEVEADIENEQILWRIDIVNKTGIPLVQVVFPLIGTYHGLKGVSQDDYLVLPEGEGKLIRNPMIQKQAADIHSGNCYPGQQSMQFAALYHKSGEGLYFACRDSGGLTKKVGLFDFDKEKYLGWYFFQEEIQSESFYNEFDIVLKPFLGDWQDAASIYREWASDQWWSKTKLHQRTDIPDWYKQGMPVISIENYATTGGTEKEQFRHSLRQIEKIESEYCRKVGPCVFFWTGWEHDGAWVSPELWPPIEGEESFRKAVDQTHDLGAKVEVYFSTVLYIVKQGKSLSFLQKEGLSAAVLCEDNNKNRYTRWWGQSTAMCLGSDWWKSRLIDTIEAMAERGIDMLQLDMFPINAPWPCWDPNHKHPLGYGLWHMKVGIDIIRACRAAARKINPEIVISTEMPCETYIPFIDVYLSRDDWRDLEAPEKRSEYTLIPLFSFVYHENMITQGYEWSMNALPSITGTIALQYVRGKIPSVFEGYGAWDPKWEPPPAAERASNREKALRLLKFTSKAAGGFGNRIIYGGRIEITPTVKFKTESGIQILDYNSTNPAVGAFSTTDSSELLILQGNDTNGVLIIELNDRFLCSRRCLTVWKNGTIETSYVFDDDYQLEYPVKGYDVLIFRFTKEQ